MKTLWCSFSVTCLLISGVLGALSDCDRVASFENVIAKDTKSIPNHHVRWLDAQTCAVEPSAISGNYKKIKEKIDRISKHIKKPTTVGSLEENRGKNAHPKVPPIDETRALRHIENFYLSANDVLTPLQEYIVGQGPLETTILDFWRAVIEANIPTILTLSMPADAGGRNPPYWEKARYPIVVCGWKIQEMDAEEVVDASAVAPLQRIVKRTFRAVHEESEETRTISHIHYENWPDNRAPEPSLFHRFLHFVSTIHPVSSLPIFVHCSAGLGRSGTFVVAHSLCKEIHALHPPIINIPRRIVELRMQRAYLVSTVVQIEAIYTAVRECAQYTQTSYTSSGSTIGFYA